MPLSSFVAAVRHPAGRGDRSPGRRTWRLAWRITLGLVLAAWCLALLAWLTLHWWILPRLDDWRPAVEAQAARALGHPVGIGRIEVRSTGWVPAFTLRDVVLRDPLGRQALHLPQVSAALSVPSLLALRLRFAQLLIEGAQLEVRRDAQGRWIVAGLDMASAAPGMDASAAADWFFEQHEFLIRGGTLRWVDEQRAAPPLQLDDVLLLVRNQGRRHELRLDATPPPDWGSRFTITAQARGALLSRAGGWQRWKGTLYAELPRADVSQLRRHVDLPVDLHSGEAALRAWVDWDRGQPLALTLDAALRKVSVRLAAGLEPVELTELGGRFVAERRAEGVTLTVERLAFATADGLDWAPSRLALQWRQAQTMSPGAASAPNAAPVTAGEFSADRLDLATLADLGERLPIGAGLHALLARLNPEGTVHALKARWDGPLDAPQHYSASARIVGLAIAAAPSPEPGGIGRPGWHGADLQFSATEAGGRADLSLADGAIELPGVFAEAVLPLSRFAARLQWRIAPAQQQVEQQVELKVVDARFDNADARGSLAATWRTGAGSGFGKGGRYPGILTLDGSLVEAQAPRIARYLPLGIAADVRGWVQGAVRSGTLHDVNFRVQGDLWDFPYVNRRDGEFRVAGRLQDVTLAPVPSEPGWESPWPAFSAVHGNLVFERNSMSFQQLRGRLWGVDLSEVKGRIRELSEHSVLEIDGQARGPAADLLRYLRSTPLNDWTGGLAEGASASGTAELKLALNLPLARLADSVVQAGVQLPGNDLRLRPDLPLLAGARGRIDATHKGVQLSALRGQALGGELQVDGGTQADGSLRFTVAGNASADGLRRLAAAGPSARLAARLSGQTSYRLQWGRSAGLQPTTDWLLTSPLSGLALDLPEPLRKPADASWPLRLSSTPEDRAAAGRQRLQLTLGPLQAAALVEQNGAAPARPLRSALAWGAPLPEPVAGGRALLVVPALDVDAWRQTWAAIADAATGPATPDSAWLPQSVQLRSPELRIAGRRITGLTLDLQRLAVGDEGWRAQVQADQAAGSIEYREPRQAGAEGRVRARLARLSLPPAEAETVADSVAGLLDRAPTSVPALDIEIDDFELRGRRLGQLAVEAVNRGGGGDETGPRNEWRLNRLQLVNPDARLDASGRWRAVAGQPRRRMAMDFSLDVADGGALLERLGFGKVVRGAKGRMTGQLVWDGSPLGFDLPTLGGNLGLALERGQFLQVEPGAARLLGVLSLQALPRRLLLDFRDVFDQGFAFDNISGDVRVRGGVASTENLRLRGVQALVLMEGSADIARETQDLRVVVVPELNTASASLAYAAINPAIGIGAFLGQWLLREPLRQASAREFRITGGWADPQVERIERKLLDPLPAAATSEVPASGPAPAASAASR
ncbi:MAG: TIGR02099 family protein [Burkholderiaceae bacterium]|nr:TIGR02099 family protein [Burkholderiaceae bacterium]